jgi:tetratricopeptide (TPR) repeat protein
LSCQLAAMLIERRRAMAAARAAAHLGVAIALCCVLLMQTGCAAFGRRGAVPEEVAASRELSRQGIAAMEHGEWPKAEELLRQAVEGSPEDPHSRRYLAEILWRRGAKDEAMRQMNAAVRIDPVEATLSARAGELSLEAGAIDEALKHAEQAIRVDPNLAGAWALRGRVFRKSNQADRAMSDFQRALDLEPQNAQILFDVAAMYRQRGQSARALATLHQLLDTLPPGDEPQAVLYLEGVVLVELGRPHRAIDSLAAAARRNPPNAEVYYRLAQAYSGAGQHAEAFVAARQALSLDANHVASRELLVQLASRGDVQTAEAQQY